MKNCTDCILDLTDACPRGAGRAVDDEICDEFVPREVYEVNKNESWQLGYTQGRIDGIDEFVKALMGSGIINDWNELCNLSERLKEQKNE